MVFTKSGQIVKNVNFKFGNNDIEKKHSKQCTS